MLGFIWVFSGLLELCASVRLLAVVSLCLIFYLPPPLSLNRFLFQVWLQVY